MLSEYYINNLTREELINLCKQLEEDNKRIKEENKQISMLIDELSNEKKETNQYISNMDNILLNLPKRPKNNLK